MRRGRGALAALATLLAGMAVPGCGGGPPARDGTSVDVQQARGRPTLSSVVREGDPAGGVALTVITRGVAPDRDSEVAAALAGLTETRLRSAGLQGVTVTVGDGAYRVRTLATTPAEVTAFVGALPAALLTPLDPADATSLAAMARKRDALLLRPLATPSAGRGAEGDVLADIARCTGEPFYRKPEGDAGGRPTPTLVESWRRAAHGVGRVAVGVAGSQAFADAAARSLSGSAPWPGALLPTLAFPREVTATAVYDAGGEGAPGGARAHVALFVPEPSQAAALAARMGDPQGALALRLGGLDVGVQIKRVDATAHAGGGCVAVTLEWSTRERGERSEVRSPIHESRLATAVALTRQELVVELAELRPDEGAAALVTRAATEPAEAAERAAWWSLARPSGQSAVRLVAAVGLAPSRDTTDASSAARATVVQAAVDRAIIMWAAPVVESRVRVEKGQGELWLLLASPCGTSSEGDGDGGLGALAAAAAAEHVAVAFHGEDVTAEPWVATDGLGVLVHAVARPGETAVAHGRRVADAAARSFAAEAIPPATLARARARVLRSVESTDGVRPFSVLASALAPGHPSWVAPWGTETTVGRASDGAVTARAQALRAGPLRVAILANDGLSQGEAASRAVDRWVVRHAGEARGCSPVTAGLPPKAGTYPFDPAPSAAGSGEVWIAAPLSRDGWTADRETAETLAATLDGEDGALARALHEGGLARRTGALVVGDRRGAALTLRVVTAPGNVDAVVAQVRVLLERLRQGGLAEADGARGAARRERSLLAQGLTPRWRLGALWRGESPRADGGPRGPGPAHPPTLADLNALSAQAFRDDALVFVTTAPAPVKGAR